MSFNRLSFSPSTFSIPNPIPTSYTTTSFTSTSFTTVGLLTPPIVNSTTPIRNRFRAWVVGLARGLKDFFKIKQRPPEPEDVPIPTPQSPAGKKVTILAEPPTKEKPISVVASIPIPFHEVTAERASSEERITPPVYPYILNPLTAPLIQTKVTLPKANKSTTLPPYRVAEGSHIESQLFTMKKPKNRAKAASTINTLMILLEIESKL